MDRKALIRITTAFGIALGTLALVPAQGCVGETKNEGLATLERAGIQSVAFISRAKRLEVGDVFQYSSFSVDPKSANIYKLSTVGGSAEPEAITSFGAGDLPAADIMAMDVSFDGKEIVFSARLDGEGEPTYGIYRIKIDGTNPEEPGEKGPALVYSTPAFDAVYPVYLPDERIYFMTNETLAPGFRQFRDEYERGHTAQAATMNIHGGDVKFGPRNLSHRVSPTLMTTADGKGQILHTNWDHLNNVNEGNLMVMNPDLSGGAEFYGKEGSGVANSYLKARQVDSDEFLAIATDREDTFQSGAIIKITRGKNEQTSSSTILTPDVPLGKEPSYDKVGRYYDAFPVMDTEGNMTHVLTSWANGPVQSDIAGGGMSEEGVNYGEGSGPPDFGLYVLALDGSRLPIFNDTDMWEVTPMPIGEVRPEPNISAAPSADDAPDGTALIGALNVFESSLEQVPTSGAYRVRIIEGFSAEEGIPDDFGLTEADGAILLGEAPIHADGSFAAYVPEDRPVHLQLIDGYGLSMVNENRWFSSASGEQRFCGGCHEERGRTSVVDPGLADAVGEGPQLFALPYPERPLADASDADYGMLAKKVIWPDADDVPAGDAARLKGIPWNLAIQPIFDGAGCADCHNGVPGPANPGVQVVDTMSDDPTSTPPWYFDLSGEMIEYTYGEMTGNFSKSHISLLLIAGMMAEPGVEIMQLDPNNTYDAYVVPESARESVLMQYVNPHRVYPQEDVNDLAFPEMPAEHPSADTPGFDAAAHRPLTTWEKYLLGIMADFGGQYYSLENSPGTEY